VWSNEQNSIFKWFAAGTGNLVVQAYAGSGKTSTAIEGIGRAPEAKILLCAFNKRIAEELQAKLTNGNAVAKTLHAIGYGCVRRYWENIRIGSDRADTLAQRVCGDKVPDAIKRLVSKLHTKGREIVPHARRAGELTNLAWQFECVPDEEWEDAGYDVDAVERYALQAMELAAVEKPVEIDFADMIYLPVRNHWLTKSYDMVVADEAQDLNSSQLEMVLGISRGRICIIGDRFQSIYTFRGADSNGMDRLKAELHAAELGLSTTYRCGTVIVTEAQRLVPGIQARPDAHEGTVTTLEGSRLIDTAQAGSFILSRTNAPLVATAMALLRAGKRARVAGRDIGQGMKMLVRKLKARSIPDLLSRLVTWETREITRLEKAKRDPAGVRDKGDTLRALAQDATGLPDLERRIDALFTDDGLGAAGVITCSSVHKAKGLEADTVYVLAATLRPNGDQEERNVVYVSITRAINNLVWVSGIK
jgi:superfamily I DNA/RNA helicase